VCRSWILSNPVYYLFCPGTVSSSLSATDLCGNTFKTLVVSSAVFLQLELCTQIFLWASYGNFYLIFPYFNKYCMDFNLVKCITKYKALATDTWNSSLWNIYWSSNRKNNWVGNYYQDSYIGKQMYLKIPLVATSSFPKSYKTHMCTKTITFFLRIKESTLMAHPSTSRNSKLRCSIKEGFAYIPTSTELKQQNLQNKEYKRTRKKGV